MTSIDRRSAIRLAIASALATQVAPNTSAAQGISGSLITPPQGQMLYRRTVDRELIDGASLRCVRDFAVSFEAFEEGYMLQGRQIHASVDAPASLAHFVRIEESRDESRVFPIAMDALGRIRSTSPQAFGEAAIASAVERAVAAIEEQTLPGGEREQMQRFVAAFHAAGQRVAAVLPQDLFAPAEGERRGTQDIALPDGKIGHVETLFGGLLDPATGLMASASREIVTRIDDSQRVTRENWLLRSM